MRNRVLHIAALAFIVMLLNSCYGSVSSNKGLSIYITDAPIDRASAVNIAIASIEIDGDPADKSTLPQTFSFSPSVVADVYAFQGGAENPLVLFGLVPAGHYTSMKVTLVTDPLSLASSITLPDGTHTLYIPGGNSPVISVPMDLSMTNGGTASITIDFDLRKSIIQDPNDSSKYQLFPSMRAVQDELAGNITGGVATTRVANGGGSCVPAVYVYQGSNVAPTDINLNAPGGSVQPFATALVGLNRTTFAFNFTLAYLPPGLYTLAFTCNADQDVADQDNSAVMNFTAGINATVQARNTSFVAFN
jgi:hypothetical protein